MDKKLDQELRQLSTEKSKEVLLNLFPTLNPDQKNSIRKQLNLPIEVN